MEKTIEEKLNEMRKQKNIRLYPIYKMFSWDLLFYYAIIFLFLTQVKNISSADVLLSEALYPLFKSLLLIPATILIDRIGKRKSLIFANLVLAFSTLSFIVATNFETVLLAQFLSAIGFIIKGICEANILYDSLEKNEKRGATFSKIDGKASSWYYYIDAVSSVIAGFLFAVNGYLPLIFCLIINIISTIMSMNFEEIETNEKKQKTTFTNEYKNLKQSMKNIFKSARLRNLLLFGAMFSGIISVLITLRSSLLSDIGIPSQYFGIIFAVLEIVSGIAAKNQFRIHKKFRNKTLASLSLPTVVSCIILGLWCNIELNFYIMIFGVLVIFLVQAISKGPFYTLIRQYLNNFTTATLRTKISSAYNFLEGIFRFLIGLFASFLLRYTITSNTITIIGCIATVIIVLMLDNMREKVGLKPEEYKEKDIKILELK